jgi:hypothetical protein
VEKCTINDYLDYVEGIIDKNEDNIFENKIYKEVVSIFKITGTIDFENIEGDDFVDGKNLDSELYLLFEFLSFKYFKLLNYSAWKIKNGC